MRGHSAIHARRKPAPVTSCATGLEKRGFLKGLERSGLHVQLFRMAVCHPFSKTVLWKGGWPVWHLLGTACAKTDPSGLGAAVLHERCKKDRVREVSSPDLCSCVVMPVRVQF